MKSTKIFFTLFLLLVSTASMAQHELSDSDKAALQERVKQKVDEFVFYLGNIVNKELSDAQRQGSIKSALELFVGKGERWSTVNGYGEKEFRNAVRMQISSINRNYSSWLSMKRYLQNQYNNIHKYGKVVIESADVVRVDNINPVGDGQYEAMAYYCQKYIAFRDGRIVYGDDSLTRARNLISLFDRNFNRNGMSKEQLLNKVNAFVKTVLERNVAFDTSGRYLWAECCCQFKYKGNNKRITLLMQKEPYAKGTFRWAVVAAKGMDAAGIINLSRYYTISPVEHEIHFMGLQDLFNENPSHAFGYRARAASIDQLSVLLAFIQTGQLKFDMVENLTYHYLGVPGFVFTIEENTRKGDNSGWLIDSLSAMNDKEKTEYIKTLLGHEK